MKKKALLSMAATIKIVLAIVSFILLALFLGKILGFFSEQTPEQACRASTTSRANVAIDVGIKKIDNIIPLACVSQEEDFPEKSIAGMNDEQIREQIMTEIGNKMALCWWMFGNGLYDNVLDSAKYDEPLCHICYSFVIDYSLTSKPNGDPGPMANPIPLDELQLFLRTHNFQPGLLYGGYANIVENMIFDFEEQEWSVYEGYRGKMTGDRVVESPTTMVDGFADFSGLYKEDPQTAAEIRTILEKLYEDLELHISIVVVTSMPEEEWGDKADLHLRLIEEWQLGSEELNNGMVFVFILNDGKLLYAAQRGIDGVLPAYYIDEVVAETVDAPMYNTDPQTAVVAFARGLQKKLELLYNVIEGGSSQILNTLQYQNSYSAYITGGVAGSHVSNAKASLQSDGGILYPACQAGQSNCVELTELKAGERYAIAYVSNNWGGDFFKKLFNKNKPADVPNMIALSEYDQLLNPSSNDKACNVIS